MTNLKTTVLGIVEATILGLSAEALFDLSWKQRAAVFAIAFLRALFGALAADARGEIPPLGPPAPAEDPRRVG